MFPSTLALPLFLTLLFTFLLLRRRRHRGNTNHPPGPPGLPVIGHLHLLGELPHRTLQSLAKTYGPIMSLRLGHVPTIILTSPEAAELFLKAHDAAFSGRPHLQASEYFSYGSKGMVFSDYGPYWRNMRKICTQNLLSTSKVESFGPLRMKEVEKMVGVLKKAATMGEVVNLSEVVHRVVEGMVYKMILGCECDHYDDDYGFDLKRLIQEQMMLFGAFNLADYVPWLGIFDLQGLTRRFKKVSKAIDQVLEKIIKQHEESASLSSSNNNNSNDFIDILLSLQNDAVFTEPDRTGFFPIDRTNIKAIVLDMIAGAFETSATVIVWALSELLRHPRVMSTLRREIAAVIGEKNNNIVQEKDLAKLNYLEMVIKETFRLHPAGSLLPRESIEDVRVGDYDVRKGTRVILNVWAMGRDERVWSENAAEFWPERFKETVVVDFRGRESLRFVPFGSGRRGCPGMELGLCTVKLVVAQIVHCFRWKLPEDVDMEEKFGLSMPKAKDLFAIPILS